MQLIDQKSILPENSIGSIVAKNFQAAGVFRSYNIDFCCGGGISLKEACKKKNVNVDEILQELHILNEKEDSDNQNFLAWEADYLIDYIIDIHHRFVRSKTEEISAYAEKVASVHGVRHPENVEILHKFKELSHEMITHLEAEENTVFPLISGIIQKRKRGEPVSVKEIKELKQQLSLMENDHDGAGNLMKEIRTLSNGYAPPADACATYQILYKNLDAFEIDLHKHVHLENNILFKKAGELI